MPFEQPTMRVSALLCGCVLTTLATVWLAGCGEDLTQPPALASYEPPAVATVSCVPNLDQRIDAAELREALNIPVRQRVNPAGSTRPVNLAGQINASGLRRWDLSAPAPDDQLATIEAKPLSGRWYASHFPSGQFVGPLDLGGRIEAVYRRTDQALELLGLASAVEDPPEGQTRIVYEQPVAVFQFPLEVGKQWVNVGRASNSVAFGLPYAGRDTYTVEVEAIGQLLLPELTLDQVMMVRTKLVSEPAVGQSTSRQQVSFVTECFGEVARATSADGEDDPNFTTAVELRRLGIGL